ncbi:helix-turn-helix domain-containing protein [Nocardia amamiensis]|uniref:Helix-turn-helix domain-containing protein n=1 Tax=Nocardia amamiensis TaxID=404578 RepID=A0ABS0D293_9NOCA|nr:helix-turn-helix domain-containing protein [Nocardia amamiensis]MBF6302238.1 helix-turn-helix domain-containing protein [Nocardia amamiensis]
MGTDGGLPPDIGERLRAIRQAAGLSLAALAARIPFSRSYLGHIETGARPASAEVVAAYTRACGEVTCDPVTLVSVLGRADVDRRSFLRTSVYSAALSATALASQSDMARLIRVDDSARVGMAEVRAVQGITDAFLRLDEVKGGGIGRTAVAEFLSTDVASLLRSRFADSTVRSAAFSAAAELAYLAGFKAHDAGEDGIGQRYFLSALRLAEESGVPGQDGFVFRILALQGSDIRQRKFSVALAEESVRRAAGHVGLDAMALFTVAVARCHAESGNKAEAMATLRQAEPYLNPEMTDGQPRWMSLWCPNKATVVHQAAKTFLAVGERAAAERFCELATSIWSPQTHARVYALTAAETGLIRWQLGNHADAVSMWRPALPILSTVSSDRASNVLRKVRKAAPELFASTPA